MAYRSARSNLNLLAVGLGAYGVVALLSAVGFGHGVLSFFVALAVAVVYLRWESVVSGNCDALGLVSRRWPGRWQLGRWFIPVVHWLTPLLAMREVWQFSHQWRVSNALLYGWWIAFLTTWWFDRVFIVALANSGVVAPGAVVALLVAIDVVAAVLAFLVAWRITVAQERLHQRNAALGLPNRHPAVDGAARDAGG